MKPNGLKHKAATSANNDPSKIFTRDEEKMIYDFCKLYFDNRMFINKDQIIQWGWEVAAIFQKMDKYKGGDKFIINFLDRWGLSIQKHTLRRSPSTVQFFCKKRDTVWTNFLLKVLHYQIKP
eukprot:95235_1